MSKATLTLITAFVLMSGCSLGTNPVYRKLNTKGDFLLSQAFKDDILCVKDTKKKSGISCFYVQNGSRVLSVR
jgi:hypothetical protein